MDAVSSQVRFSMFGSRVALIPVRFRIVKGDSMYNAKKEAYV